jgi:glutathione reductase (NADPH)
MSETTDFDLIVLGTGTAGSSIAETCRKAGRSVAIIDIGAFGGTCALRGCEPKKVLWTLAEAADHAHRMAPAGLSGGDDVAIDWAALQRFKRSFTDPVPRKTEQHFQSLGIEAFHGAPRFVARDAIVIDNRHLRARHVVIATGARPADLPIGGKELLATSEDFLALDRLPRRLVLVGGGYIAFEVAHIARRGGADVTIVHQDDKPLAGFDRVLVARLLDESRRVGIHIELDTEVKRVERQGDGFRVIARRRGGDDVAFYADLALHAAGRVPNLDDLSLETAGIERDGKRLRLDKYLRSASNPIVFAAGDAAQAGPALTPVATIDAHAVARNLLETCTHEPDYRGVPSAVFSIPPLTRVGLTEDEARERKLDFELREGDMANYESVRRLRHGAAAYRVLIERGSRKLLGAHLLGPGAEETINLFALAIRLDLDADRLGQLASCYPSFGSNVTGMLG